MKSFIAGKNDEGVRLSRFCEKVCLNAPKNLLYKSFRNKRIKVNGKKQDPDYRINFNDLIEIYINDEFFELDKTLRAYFSVDQELDIIYEDENILIVFKPSGLLCHSDNKLESNLIDNIINYLHKKGEYLPDNENTFTPALCNRIDQGTEGLVIAAKTYKAVVAINLLIKENKIKKQYLCITQSPLIDGEYKAFHKRNLTDKKVTIFKDAVEDSKEIITQFKNLKNKNSLNLIEATLVTGRTHQIRAHLAFIGCPIIGDKKYGKPFNGVKSQLLSAYKIHFEDMDDVSFLSYLSGKTFTTKKSTVTDFFNR